MVVKEILFRNMKSPSHECIMTFLSLTSNSDFPTDQTFHHFHDLDTDLNLHRITSGFHGAFASRVACQQEMLSLPDTWFCPPFWDLLMLYFVETNFPELAVSFLDLSPGIPLGTFSILLLIKTENQQPTKVERP